MGHGDNRGIVIPPKVASIQVDLIEIMANKDQRVSEVSEKIRSLLENNNITVRVDKTNKSVGFKVSQSEIEGVPIRIEIGPRDLENNKVLITGKSASGKSTMLKLIKGYYKNYEGELLIGGNKNSKSP